MKLVPMVLITVAIACVITTVEGTYDPCEGIQAISKCSDDYPGINFEMLGDAWTAVASVHGYDCNDASSKTSYLGALECYRREVANCPDVHPVIMEDPGEWYDVMCDSSYDGVCLNRLFTNIPMMTATCGTDSTLNAAFEGAHNPTESECQAHYEMNKCVAHFTGECGADSGSLFLQGIRHALLAACNGKIQFD